MPMKTMMMIIWWQRWCIPDKGMLIGERKLVAISLTSTALTSRELTVIGIIRWALRIWDDSIHNIFNLEARLKKEITFILSVHTLFNWLVVKHIHHVQLPWLIISSSWPDKWRASAGEELRAGDLAPLSTAALLPPGSWHESGGDYREEVVQNIQPRW